MREDPAKALLDWLRTFGGEECAAVAARVGLDDREAMLRVLTALMDCVLRRIMPLPAKYAADPDAHANLAALPSFEAAAEVVRALRTPGPSALGSARAALISFDRVSCATSRDEANEATLYIFGALHMAVMRKINKGTSRADIAAALQLAFAQFEGSE